jgi:branched-chain amino acid transport system permease protein
MRRRLGRRHLVAIAITCTGLAAAPFLLLPYPLGLLTLALAYGLFAFGLDLAWGRAGVVSIGHAAFFGLGAYGVAIAVDRELPVLPMAAGAVLAAALVAWLVGRSGLSPRAQASTMAVLTLALTLIAEQAARSLLGLTNGGNGLFVPGSGVVSNFYRTAVVVVVVVVLVWLVVLRGALGRRFLAVRVNESRAAHLGIDPQQTKTLAFVLSAAVAAIAGAVAAPVMSLVSPSVAGIIMSTQVLVWVAVGGRGTIAGAFIGAALVTIGQQYLGDAIGSWYLLVLGLAFILVVRFFPAGLVGGVLTLMRRPVAEQAAQGAALESGGSVRREERRAAVVAGATALEVTGVVKTFGQVPVIRGVDLEVPAGQVLCLIGPNGAGKTTLLSIVGGDLVAEQGRVALFGRDVSNWTPHRRARLGLGRLFQIPSVFLELTPRQNLLLARAEARRVIELPADLRRFELQDSLRAQDLPLADRRALELAVVLTGGPDVVLLDEPAAGLSHEDSIRLARTLRTVAEEADCTLVTGEHDMEIVRELADRVVVLANGRVLVDGSMDEVARHDEVRSAYLGAVCCWRSPAGRPGTRTRVWSTAST